jgi:guanylate kinase
MSADDLIALALVGPSGSGKSTLCSHLLNKFPGELCLSVSYTTRAPRGTERDGVEYHFIDRTRFQEMIAEGRFLEWAEVHSNYYGTAASIFEESAKRGAKGVLFDIDVQGARQILAKVPSLVSVMVVPPSWSELERRLRARGTDRDEVIARRMSSARSELSHYAMFDYLLLNDDLMRACDEIAAIYGAECAKRKRRAAHAEWLLRQGR